MTRTISLTVLALLLLLPATACAWGRDGHRIVADVANRYLDPKAAHSARDLLALENDTTLADVASWADDYRNTHRTTGPWHYVDIPISDDGYDPARDCKRSNCIVGKIKKFRSQLADKSLSPDKRLIALKFLVHLVGDLHQPLHCSNNDDKGGNAIKVDWNGSETNLHSVWDSAIIGEGGMAEPDFPAKLASKITDANMKAWQKGSVEDWANESYGIAKSFIYTHLPDAKTHELPQAYQHQAAPIVGMQLEKAGVRLAAILNSALD